MNEDMQFLKTRANFIRHAYIEEMEKYLLAFDSEISKKNIKIKWITDEEELVEELEKEMPKKTYNKVCFDVKNIPQALLEKKNFIKNVLVTEMENNTETAEHLVVQADFGIVDNASLVFINKASKNNFNRVKNIHIILNINDLIAKKSDLETILYLKNSEEKQFLPSDIKIISAPMMHINAQAIQISSAENFIAEPVEITLYLYDNGITKILEDNVLREALYCIECGRCGKSCPVYRITKKLSPIELVRNNCFEETHKTQQIFENTTLCGNCNEVCPVQIPFTDLLIKQMQYVNNKHSREKVTDLYKAFMKRAKMNSLGKKIQKYFFIKKQYGKNKKLASYFRNQKEPFFNVSQINKIDK